MFEIIDLILSRTKSDGEISDLYSMDKGSICKIRHKQSWKEVWRLYYRNKSIATTIENTEK